MTDLTGIGEYGVLGQDLVKLVEEILSEREPLREFRIMSKLSDKLKALCIQYPNLIPEALITAFCGNMPLVKQQALTKVVTEELQAENLIPNNSITQNLKPKTMNTETAEVLLADELSLTESLAKEARVIGLFIGKADLFTEAVLNGMKTVDDSFKPTVQQLVDKSFDTLQKIASLTGNVAFIKLSVISKNLYDDCATGKVNIINLFRALIQSKGEIKTLEAEVSTRTADPNLLADEIALATDLGAMAKMLALYFGGDKAEAFLTAFAKGLTDVADGTKVELKDVVDGAFANLDILAKIINNNIVKMVVKAVWDLYDEFAGGKTGIIALWESVSAAKTQILAAQAQGVAA